MIQMPPEAIKGVKLGVFLICKVIKIDLVSQIGGVTLVKVQRLGSIEFLGSSNDLVQMYRRRIQSNLGRKRGRNRVPRLDGAWNAKEMKARCQDGITNM